jgi:hypothetical protein
MDLVCRYFVLVKVRIVSSAGALRIKVKIKILGILAYHLSYSCSACKSVHVVLHCLQLKYLITPVCF